MLVVVVVVVVVASLFLFLEETSTFFIPSIIFEATHLQKGPQSQVGPQGQFIRVQLGHGTLSVVLVVISESSIDVDILENCCFDFGLRE